MKLKTYRQFSEEMGVGSVPTNTAGGGGVEGIGIGPKGEPGVPKRKKLRVLKRGQRYSIYGEGGSEHKRIQRKIKASNSWGWRGNKK